jgi:hypothetical protein
MCRTGSWREGPKTVVDSTPRPTGNAPSILLRFSEQRDERIAVVRARPDGSQRARAGGADGIFGSWPQGSRRRTRSRSRRRWLRRANSSPAFGGRGAKVAGANRTGTIGVRSDRRRRGGPCGSAFSAATDSMPYHLCSSRPASPCTGGSECVRMKGWARHRRRRRSGCRSSSPRCRSSRTSAWATRWSGRSARR